MAKEKQIPWSDTEKAIIAEIKRYETQIAEFRKVAAETNPSYLFERFGMEGMVAEFAIGELERFLTDPHKDTPDLRDSYKRYRVQNMAKRLMTRDDWKPNSTSPTSNIINFARVYAQQEVLQFMAKLLDVKQFDRDADAI